MEYRDYKLLSFLGEKGTLYDFSCPYTSQQNGWDVRKHRHILVSFCSMFIPTSCPERTWGETTLTVVHIINHLPSFVLGNVSFFVHFISLHQIKSHLGVWLCLLCPLSAP